MKPLIGITPSPSTDAMSHGTFDRWAMASTYVSAVLAAGGIPIVLPPQDGNTEALLDAFDGILLSGGGDIDPAVYGDADIHPETYGLNAARDRFELELVGEAVARDLPLLGICRGIQVLNAALGGTLIQHVTDQHPGAISHRQHEAGKTRDEIGHVVTLPAASPLRGLFGTDEVGVNSYHHQAIRDLAPGLVPAAYSPDGLIEAVTLPSKAFVVGVQWHPEMMFALHSEQLWPFRALVEAAEARHLAASRI